jgi:electron transfer flavoprotein beta subunit
MKVVVAIKHILDPSGFTVNRKSERVFVNREEYIINPADLNALELALRLKDESSDVEVIALSMGPPRVDDALREAIARGADRAVLVTDPALAGLKADTAGAARLLAAAVEKIGDVDLLVCGAAALDSGAGEMPGRLSEALGWPLLPDVLVVDRVDVGAVRVSGRAARWEAGLPAVLTVPRDANRPRHIYGARAVNVYREELVGAWGLAELGFTPDDLEPLTWVAGRRFPPQRTLGTRLDGSMEQAVAALVAQLRARELTNR